MRYIYYALITSLVIISCGQNDTKQRELDLKERELDLKEKELAMDSTLNANAIKSKNPTDVKKVTQQKQPKANTNSTGNEEFDNFFVVFRKVASSKDKSQITQLMYFPFLWNADFQNQSTFLSISYEVDAAFEITKAKKPSKSKINSFEGSSVGPTGPYTTKTYSSVYEAHTSTTWYYFGKVNSQYKLVAILTPG